MDVVQTITPELVGFDGIEEIDTDLTQNIIRQIVSDESIDFAEELDQEVELALNNSNVVPIVSGLLENVESAVIDNTSVTREVNNRINAIADQPAAVTNVNIPETDDTNQKKLIEKLETLINLVKKDKEIAVYLDSKKVGAGLVKRSQNF